MNEQNNNDRIPVGLEQLQKEFASGNANKNFPKNENDRLKNGENSVKIMEGENSDASNVSPPPVDLYKPLPGNDSIVLKRDQKQVDWDKAEDERMKLQRGFFSNIRELQTALNKKKILNKTLLNSDENTQKTIKIELEELDTNIQKYKNNINIFQDITAYKPIKNEGAVKMINTNNETKQKVHTLNELTSNSPVFFYEIIFGINNVRTPEISTNLLASTLVKLYLYDDFKNKYLILPPNTSLFWYNCDLKDEDITDDFWKSQITDFKTISNGKDILFGRDSTKILAKALKLEAVREIFDSIDGEPNREAWAIASWIFAREASGTVFVANGSLNEGDTSHWRLIEHPTLMHNNKVDMIASIDIKNPSKVNSIEFPNGLIREKLSECTFEISKASISRIIEASSNQDEKTAWEILRSETTSPKITYNRLFNVNLPSLKKKSFKLDANTCELTEINKGTEIRVDNTPEAKSKCIDLILEKIVGQNRKLAEAINPIIEAVKKEIPLRLIQAENANLVDNERRL